MKSFFLFSAARLSLCLAILLALSSLTMAGVIYQYEAQLDVSESIHDLLDGTYRYDYSFTNTDVSPILTFIIYTTFGMTDVTSASENWFEMNFNIPGVHPAYDARNLDPAISAMASMFKTTLGLPIAPGGSMTNFSFIAGVYDPSPKLFVYETDTSGPADITGEVAAAGHTTLIPEPASITMLALGALALTKRKNR